MDLYLSAQDTLSLQEMLDCDIKTEIDNVFGSTDLSLSLSELPPLDLDDALAGPGDMTMWFTSSGFLHSGNSNSSNSNFNLDFVGGDAAAMMVNPSSVMPMTLVTAQPSTALTDVSSSTTALPTTSSKSSPLSPVEEKETTFPVLTVNTSKEVTRTAATSTCFTSTTNSLLRKPQTSATIRIATSSTHSSNNAGLPSIIKTVPVISTSTKVAQSQHPHQQQKHLTQIQISNIRTVPISHLQNKRQSQLNNNNNKHFSAADMDYDERPFPKPAYSYSCLIAMALKNSQTGSLPVSEIYNFMCEHFPYFKTAPNGWKNSVRHNLSLNKCFEKIEKPAGNGSQRKGCLWAMNPAKIAKMDEEVQKWSKKDPMAIRKAMICPDNLEMLERGEMKREFSGLSSLNGGCSVSLSDGEESDEDLGGSAPTTPLTPASQHNAPEFIDINELNGHESIDESSLTGFDLEVADGIYEELDTDDDDKVNLGITLTSAVPNDFISPSSIHVEEEEEEEEEEEDDDDDDDEEEEEEEEYIESRKRSRLNGSTIQGNYVYKPMVSTRVDSPASVVGSRRKAPLFFRASPSASSLIKLEDP